MGNPGPPACSNVRLSVSAVWSDCFPDDCCTWSILFLFLKSTTTGTPPVDKTSQTGNNRRSYVKAREFCNAYLGRETGRRASPACRGNRQVRDGNRPSKASSTRKFAETRLRRVVGQRYDNGHRHDGIRSQELHYSTDLTKGPETLSDAPGMQRIKIPFGGLNPEQMDVLADLAEEYADGVLHVTTRQDFQYHFVHIEDTPAIMRRLAAVGITTREACGNSIRNVTACPLAGVCNTETLDVIPYAKATAKFMLGHPDAQNFGRKFKIAFSGCRQEACALVNMHDLGAIAVTRVENGKVRRGFEPMSAADWARSAQRKTV